MRHRAFPFFNPPWKCNAAAPGLLGKKTIFELPLKSRFLRRLKSRQHLACLGRDEKKSGRATRRHRAEGVEASGLEDVHSGPEIDVHVLVRKTTNKPEREAQEREHQRPAAAAGETYRQVSCITDKMPHSMAEDDHVDWAGLGFILLVGITAFIGLTVFISSTGQLSNVWGRHTPWQQMSTSIGPDFSSASFTALSASSKTAASAEIPSTAWALALVGDGIPVLFS